MGRTVTLCRGYSKIWALNDSSSLQHTFIDLSKLKISLLYEIPESGNYSEQIII